jgi:hypothetical protein
MLLFNICGMIMAGQEAKRSTSARRFDVIVPLGEQATPVSPDGGRSVRLRRGVLDVSSSHRFS